MKRSQYLILIFLIFSSPILYFFVIEINKKIQIALIEKEKKELQWGQAWVVSPYYGSDYSAPDSSEYQGSSWPNEW